MNELDFGLHRSKGEITIWPNIGKKILSHNFIHMYQVATFVHGNTNWDSVKYYWKIEVPRSKVNITT